MSAVSSWAIDRATIIAEIRRTAEENQGTPLGKTLFARETGIKEADWSGKFWARWSDAVREAGYEPNVMQGRYDEIMLLGRLVEVVEDLGKWPTSAELRLHVRNHEGFPSHNTFARLGSRAEQAALMLEHREELGLPDSVAAICEEVSRDAEPTVEKEAEMGSRVTEPNRGLACFA